MNYDPDLVGRRLRAARSEKGLDPLEVERATSILGARLCEIESGERPAAEHYPTLALWLDEAAALCRLYGISLDDLVAPGISGPEGG